MLGYLPVSPGHVLRTTLEMWPGGQEYDIPHAGFLLLMRQVTGLELHSEHRHCLITKRNISKNR